MAPSPEWPRFLRSRRDRAPAKDPDMCISVVVLYISNGPYKVSPVIITFTMSQMALNFNLVIKQDSLPSFCMQATCILSQVSKVFNKKKLILFKLDLHATSSTLQNRFRLETDQKDKGPNQLRSLPAASAPKRIDDQKAGEYDRRAVPQTGPRGSQQTGKMLQLFLQSLLELHNSTYSWIFGTGVQLVNLSSKGMLLIESQG